MILWFHLDKQNEGVGLVTTSCQQNLTISMWLGGGGGVVHSDHHELIDSPKTVCQNDQFLGQKNDYLWWWQSHTSTVLCTDVTGHKEGQWV